MACKFTRENIERLSSRIERQIEWRRGKVVELDAQGHSQPEIASTLHVSVGTVNGDLAYLREQAKSNIKRYIDERLPQEYEKCLIGLNLIHKRAWNIAETLEIDEKTQIQALSLAKECYGMKMELLTNATVVDDAIRFVAANQEQTIRTKATDGSEIDIKHRNDVRPFNEINNDLEDKQHLLDNNTSGTTNQVF